MRLICCLTAVVLVACAGRGVAPDAERDVRAERAAWNAAFASRDTAVLAEQWAPAGTLSTGAGIWRGREEILREHYLSLFAGRPDVTFAREPERVTGHDGWNLVYETGRWVERWSEPDGTTELRGAYFTMWRRAGGRWRKVSEIFVPDYCAGGAYCAPRPERPTP
jgi:ketosteroid isomerase-like protein